MERAALIGETPEYVASSGKRKKKKHGKIAFAELAKVISARWKTVDDETRAKLMQIAQHEKQRYYAEMEEYRRLQKLEVEAIAREEAAREEATSKKSSEDQKVTIEPIPLQPNSAGRPSISDLANQLDEVMTDIIIAAFLWIG